MCQATLHCMYRQYCSMQCNNFQPKEQNQCLYQPKSMLTDGTYVHMYCNLFCHTLPSALPLVSPLQFLHTHLYSNNVFFLVSTQLCSSPQFHHTFPAPLTYIPPSYNNPPHQLVFQTLRHPNLGASVPPPFIHP